MKSYILSDSGTRAEYKRRWQALARAKTKGLNIDLLCRFYAAMIKKGYERTFVIETVYYAAQNGVFGYIKKWER